MTKYRRFTFFLFTFFFLSTSAQVNKLLRKAQNYTDKGELQSAINNYFKVLGKEPDNRKANLGLGMIYCEYLDNFTSAQPFLEKAILLPVKDTAYDLIFALAKCYHFNGDFDRALSFIDRLKGVQDLEGESNFEKEIAKRRADCQYAKNHQSDSIDKNIYFVNAGKTINTEFPEYVPVLLGKNEILFTSKRQDDPKEELNYLDGKYYESMYIATIGPNNYSNLRRYALPDKLVNSKMYNHHFSVVSLSQDGKKLFTFKDSRLYEISIDDRSLNAPAELKIKQFNHYENHAFLTEDGNTLYFTSDVEGGLGGTDIYKSIKDSSGNWANPVNLGAPINTPFNEDAPFLSSDGTLYFASEGLPGFGNYDIYKSNFVNGSWTEPYNLGQPINTTAHDIFLVTDSINAVGYFSSGRKAGYGDMDIYKIIYLDKFPKDCQPYDARALYVSAEDSDTSDFKNKVILNLASNYQLLSINWTINGVAIEDQNLTQEFDYHSTGTFPVHVKVMAGCDTCLTPLIACIDFENKIEKTAPAVILANSEGTLQTHSTEQIARDQKENEEIKTVPSNSVTAREDASATTQNEQINSSESKKDKILTEKSGALAAQSPAKALPQALSAEEMRTLGFSGQQILFDLNKSDLLNTDILVLRDDLGVLLSQKDIFVTISGYADARGPAQLNKDLSLKRAQSVKKFLVAAGLPLSRILQIKGEGATNFVNECSIGVECSEEKHMENRRVEITFVRIVKS